MTKMCVAKKEFAVFAFLVAGCITARPQINTTAGAAVPTQVVIIGTIHEGHLANKKYSLDTLRNIIVAVKPSAILVELPPKISGWPTVESGRVTNGLAVNENMAANRAADALGVKVFQYDVEGRNEYYRKTHYLERVKAAERNLNDWMNVETLKDAKSIQARSARLAVDAMMRQSRINKDGRPEELNSAAYDMLIATKRGMLDDILPKLLAMTGQRGLAGECFFIADVWHERNRTMARNIQDIANAFAGKRVVVLTGSEHRYILRELLGNVPELELKEFYEIPEWTASTRSNHQGDCILIFEGGTGGILCKWAGRTGLRRKVFDSGLVGFVVEDGDAKQALFFWEPERPLWPTHRSAGRARQAP